MQTIYPIIRYQDAPAAIEWLCSAAGFELLFRVPETGHDVRHAPLTMGQGVAMVGTLRDDDELHTPARLGGCSQSALVIFSLSCCPLCVSLCPLW